MSNNKKRDDEVLILTLVGIIFTGFLVGIDFGYSSFGQMAFIAKLLIAVVHLILTIFWALSFINWKDPNFDKFRKWAVGLCVVLALIVGIHHALVREDKQVIIDSKENAAKP